MQLFSLLVLASFSLQTSLPERRTSGATSYLQALARNADKDKLDIVLGPMETIPPVKLTNPTTFEPLDYELLVKGLEFSYLSMCSKVDLIRKACICDKEYDSVEYINSVEYQSDSVVAYHKETAQMIVSYKYTSSLRNWLTNLDYIMTNMTDAPEGTKVHRGMYLHYMSVHNETMAKAANILATRDVKKIFVTGYSLGGSIAIISTPFWAKFKATHNVPVTVASYSGARPGNIQAKNYFESLGINIIHYSNKNDAVVNLPPRFAGYVHVGLEIHERKVTSSKTELVVCSQEFDEDPNCAFGNTDMKSMAVHIMPFNNVLPLPPFCSRGTLTNSPIPKYID
ncbi:hypothetical protein DSO57_1012628 [Entomophthora muscae]|uniref:Uncharacterized protein n=1 Tax=Entomophthora muscae TaxID=34485 RepID=A0ACC2S7Z8_9FUNG|nr:hypothetical protein DSO57_1012628 [Entomophthora muscae]